MKERNGRYLMKRKLYSLQLYHFDFISKIIPRVESSRVITLVSFSVTIIRYPIHLTGHLNDVAKPHQCMYPKSSSEAPKLPPLHGRI